MKKLSLDVDTLAVETFAAEKDEQENDGTVHGHAYTDPTCTSCQNTTRVGNCFCTECLSCRCA